MFCYQCEQTAMGKGCTKIGVCGKTEEISDIQDLIVFATRGLALAALEADKKAEPVLEVGRLVVRALFATVTNVNFDQQPLLGLLNSVVLERDKLFRSAGAGEALLRLPIASFRPAGDEQGMREQAKAAGISVTALTDEENTNSLACTLLYGLKGIAAYTDHASILGQEDPEHYKEIFKLLVFGFDGAKPSLNDWVQAVLECGKVNLKAMELLDAGNTGQYGHPEPTEVPLYPRPGKAILVTGHDLKDLHDLLKQTQGKGINIYTHGEMLPTHAYPELKKFAHFAGHFGTAWQNQIQEMPNFPGAILFTTNCIQHPAPSYSENVFTTGLVGWPGCTHLANGDFAPVIECALALPGFSEADSARFPQKKVMVGFGRNTVLGVAPAVIEAVKSGAIKHFFLVGGCDGAKSGRNYYTEFVEKAPRDTIILTLACGKFRFFDKDLGNIGGIPRLLDVGQCNDAYSAVKIALALADAFQCGVNDLPLSLILSWYEQKAVAILLTLLYLGIKNIKLGPSLPAFITPAVLQVLVENFNIAPISTPEADLEAALGN